MPKVNFTEFTVTRVVVHDVPYHLRNEDGGPDLSEVEANLTIDVQTFLEQRIKDTIHYNGFPVEFVEDHDSPIAESVSNILNDSGTFIEMSQQIALHLYGIQGGRNSAGLLMVAESTLNSAQAVVIVKVQRTQGTKVEKIERSKKKTFDIEHVRNLMLAENTRLFKAAIFAANGDDVTGYASDPQGPSDALADFFLDRFLGCQLVEEPRVTTQKFFNAAHTYINNKIADPSERTDAYLGLMSEMKSGARRLDPEEFAKKHIVKPHRQPFLNYLRELEAPTTRFDKDTDLVRKKLIKLHVSFTSGAAVIAPSEAIDEGIITMETSSNGHLKVTIDDEVQEMKGRKQ